MSIVVIDKETGSIIDRYIHIGRKNKRCYKSMYHGYGFVSMNDIRSVYSKNKFNVKWEH